MNSFIYFILFYFILFYFILFYFILFYFNFILIIIKKYIHISLSFFKTIQEELKTGSYGGPTFDNYPQLEYLIKESGCHRIPQASMGTTCETIVYDGSYGKYIYIYIYILI